MPHLSQLEQTVAGLLVLATFAGLMTRTVIVPVTRFCRRLAGRVDKVLDLTAQLPDVVEAQQETTSAVEALTDRVELLHDTSAAAARLSAIEDGKLAGRVQRIERDVDALWRHIRRQFPPTPREATCDD